jgi:hypothetical protein
VTIITTHTYLVIIVVLVLSTLIEAGAVDLEEGKLRPVVSMHTGRLPFLPRSIDGRWVY